jgi:hypothetical protein
MKIAIRAAGHAGKTGATAAGSDRQSALRLSGPQQAA